MTIAEIHGKSPLTTSEDMLTANVFTAFRYLPAHVGIIGFLRSIKGVGDVIAEPDSEASAEHFFTCSTWSTVNGSSTISADR